MTTFPYPEDKEPDKLLERRALGLSYLWPLAVAAGLVPTGSKPSDVFGLMKSWQRDDDSAATVAIQELYVAGTLWAWVDRVRAELVLASGDPVTAPDSWWAGTQHAPPQKVRGYADPGREHERLWRDYHLAEKKVAARLEELCRKAAANRQQTAGASDAKGQRAKNTEGFIRDMARQTPGVRKHVARLIEKSLAEQDEKEFNRLSLSTILNTFSKLFPGAAWEQRS